MWLGARISGDVRAGYDSGVGFWWSMDYGKRWGSICPSALSAYGCVCGVRKHCMRHCINTEDGARDRYTSATREPIFFCGWIIIGAILLHSRRRGIV